MARIWNTRMAAEYMEFKGMIVSFRCQQCGPDSPILDFGQALKHMPFEHHIMPILHWQVKDIES